jgi:hypothetical protein
MTQRVAFERVWDCVQRNVGRWQGGSFYVPGHLVGGHARDLVDVVDPYAFFGDILARLAGRCESVRSGDVRALYWWHPRSHASLNGRPGTALAQIAFLESLITLGITDLVLLPSAEVGTTNRRSASGSPFAVSNPFALDPTLADPLLADAVDVLDQHRAFVHACHLAGLSVSSIVPMATLAIDSHLFSLFPSLGYWWDVQAGTLLVPDGDTHSPSLNDSEFVGPAIADWARARFQPAPQNARLEIGPDGQSFFAGKTPEGARLTLANATPDVIAGDPLAYTWLDSATVNFDRAVVPGPMGVAAPDRLLDHDALSIVALTLAFRWAELGEDGAVVDVAPNVPLEVLGAADTIAANWTPELSAFVRSPLSQISASALLTEIQRAMVGTVPPVRRWLMAEELFTFGRAGSRFDAVTGPLAYSVGAYSHDPASSITMLERHVRALQAEAGTGRYAAAAALHDTRPPSPPVFLLLTGVLGLLPGAIPTVFSGLEHGSTHLTNGEFGFSGYPAMADYRQWVGVDGLALFNAWPFDWTAADPAVWAALSDTLGAVLDLQARVKPTTIFDIDRRGDRTLSFAVEGPGGSARCVLNLDELWVSDPVSVPSEGFAITNIPLSSGAVVPACSRVAFAFADPWATVAPLSARITVCYSDDD